MATPMPMAAEIVVPTVQGCIDRALAGDEAAFSELVREFSGRLYQFVVAMGIGNADAEDLVQEAFIRVYHHLDRYDRTYAFSTWIFTIVRRLALNHLGRRRLRTLPMDAAMKAVPLVDDAQAEIREQAGTVWARAREVLPERHFQALWLRYGEELDPSAIGKVLGITGLHARVLVHRARARLTREFAMDHRSTTSREG